MSAPRTLMISENRAGQHRVGAIEWVAGTLDDRAAVRLWIRR